MADNLKTLIEQRKKLQLVSYVSGGEGSDNNLVQLNDKAFKTGIESILARNNGWLWFFSIFLVALAIFIAVIIWQVRMQKTYVVALLGGGQGVGIAAIVARMAKMYGKKRDSEILLFLYENAESEGEKQKLLDKVLKFLDGQ